MTAVIAQHCRILPFGWTGVWLFFVISGFVVTASLLSRPGDGGPADKLARFYARRAARIWPIYLAYVVIVFLASALASGQLQWRAFASLVLFYNNFQAAFADGDFKGGGASHLWTISVEFQFYLVFGFAFAYLSRRKLIVALLACLLIAPLLRLIGGEWLTAAGYKPLNAAYAIYVFSPMHFDSFAAGALLALGRDRWRRPGPARALLLAAALAMLVYVGAYVWVNIAHGAVGLAALKRVLSGILFGDMRQVFAYSAVAAVSAGLVATALSGGVPWTAILANRAVQAVGRASYGGYVYHLWLVKWSDLILRAFITPGVSMAGRLEFGVLRFALVLPVTIGVALLSYRYIEQPIIRRVGRRLANRPQPIASAGRP